MDKKGQKALSFTTGLIIVILLGIVVLGGFGSLFGVDFNFTTPIFLALIALGIFIIFRFIVQSGAKKTDTEDFLFLAGGLGVIVFLLITFKDQLLPFSAFAPFSSAVNEIGAVDLGGIPINIIILIGAIILLSNKKLRRKFR